MQAALGSAGVPVARATRTTSLAAIYTSNTTASFSPLTSHARARKRLSDLIAAAGIAFPVALKRATRKQSQGGIRRLWHSMAG